jgi:hypothetical protein
VTCRFDKERKVFPSEIHTVKIFAQISYIRNMFSNYYHYHYSYYLSRNTPIGAATGCGLECQVTFPAETRAVPLRHSAATALGPTQLSIQWVSGTRGISLEPDNDHSPALNTEIMELNLHFLRLRHGVVLN